MDIKFLQSCDLEEKSKNILKSCFDQSNQQSNSALYFSRLITRFTELKDACGKESRVRKILDFGLEIDKKSDKFKAIGGGVWFSIQTVYDFNTMGVSVEKSFKILKNLYKQYTEPDSKHSDWCPLHLREVGCPYSSSSSCSLGAHSSVGLFGETEGSGAFPIEAAKIPSSISLKISQIQSYFKSIIIEHTSRTNNASTNCFWRSSPSSTPLNRMCVSFLYLNKCDNPECILAHSISCLDLYSSLFPQLYSSSAQLTSPNEMCVPPKTSLPRVQDVSVASLSEAIPYVCPFEKSFLCGCPYRCMSRLKEFLCPFSRSPASHCEQDVLARSRSLRTPQISVSSLEWRDLVRDPCIHKGISSTFSLQSTTTTEDKLPPSDVSQNEEQNDSEVLKRRGTGCAEVKRRLKIMSSNSSKLQLLLSTPPFSFFEVIDALVTKHCSLQNCARANINECLPSNCPSCRDELLLFFIESLHILHNANAASLHGANKKNKDTVLKRLMNLGESMLRTGLDHILFLSARETSAEDDNILTDILDFQGVNPNTSAEDISTNLSSSGYGVLRRILNNYIPSLPREAPLNLVSLRAGSLIDSSRSKSLDLNAFSALWAWHDIIGKTITSFDRGQTIPPECFPDLAELQKYLPATQMLSVEQFGLEWIKLGGKQFTSNFSKNSLSIDSSFLIRGFQEPKFSFIGSTIQAIMHGVDGIQDGISNEYNLTFKAWSVELLFQLERVICQIFSLMKNEDMNNNTLLSNGTIAMTTSTCFINRMESQGLLTASDVELLNLLRNNDNNTFISQFNTNNNNGFIDSSNVSVLPQIPKFCASSTEFMNQRAACLGFSSVHSDLPLASFSHQNPLHSRFHQILLKSCMMPLHARRLDAKGSLVNPFVGVDVEQEELLDYAHPIFSLPKVLHEPQDSSTRHFQRMRTLMSPVDHHVSQYLLSLFDPRPSEEDLKVLANSKHYFDMVQEHGYNSQRLTELRTFLPRGCISQSRLAQSLMQLNQDILRNDPAPSIASDSITPPPEFSMIETQKFSLYDIRRLVNPSQPSEVSPSLIKAFSAYAQWATMFVHDNNLKDHAEALNPSELAQYRIPLGLVTADNARKVLLVEGKGQKSAFMCVRDTLMSCMEKLGVLSERSVANYWSAHGGEVTKQWQRSWEYFVPVMKTNKVVEGDLVVNKATENDFVDRKVRMEVNVDEDGLSERMYFEEEEDYFDVCDEDQLLIILFYMQRSVRNTFAHLTNQTKQPSKLSSPIKNAHILHMESDGEDESDRDGDIKYQEIWGSGKSREAELTSELYTSHGLASLRAPHAPTLVITSVSSGRVVKMADLLNLTKVLKMFMDNLNANISLFSAENDDCVDSESEEENHNNENDDDDNANKFNSGNIPDSKVVAKLSKNLKLAEGLIDTLDTKIEQLVQSKWPHYIKNNKNNNTTINGTSNHDDDMAFKNDNDDSSFTSSNFDSSSTSFDAAGFRRVNEDDDSLYSEQETEIIPEDETQQHQNGNEHDDFDDSKSDSSFSNSSDFDNHSAVIQTKNTSHLIRRLVSRAEETNIHSIFTANSKLIDKVELIFRTSTYFSSMRNDNDDPDQRNDIPTTKSCSETGILCWFPASPPVSLHLWSRPPLPSIDFHVSLVLQKNVSPLWNRLDLRRFRHKCLSLFSWLLNLDRSSCNIPFFKSLLEYFVRMDDIKSVQKILSIADEVFPLLRNPLLDRLKATVVLHGATTSNTMHEAQRIQRGDLAREASMQMHDVLVNFTSGDSPSPLLFSCRSREMFECLISFEADISRRHVKTEKSLIHHAAANCELSDLALAYRYGPVGSERLITSLETFNLPCANSGPFARIKQCGAVEFEGKHDEEFSASRVDKKSSDLPRESTFFPWSMPAKINPTQRNTHKPLNRHILKLLASASIELPINNSNNNNTPSLSSNFWNLSSNFKDIFVSGDGGTSEASRHHPLLTSNFSFFNYLITSHPGLTEVMSPSPFSASTASDSQCEGVLLSMFSIDLSNSSNSSANNKGTFQRDCFIPSTITTFNVYPPVEGSAAPWTANDVASLLTSIPAPDPYVVVSLLHANSSLALERSQRRDTLGKYPCEIANRYREQLKSAFDAVARCLLLAGRAVFKSSSVYHPHVRPVYVERECNCCKLDREACGDSKCREYCVRVPSLDLIDSLLGSFYFQNKFEVCGKKVHVYSDPSNHYNLASMLHARFGNLYFSPDIQVEVMKFVIKREVELMKLRRVALTLWRKWMLYEQLMQIPELFLPVIPKNSHQSGRTTGSMIKPQLSSQGLHALLSPAALLNGPDLCIQYSKHSSSFNRSAPLRNYKGNNYNVGTAGRAHLPSFQNHQDLKDVNNYFAKGKFKGSYATSPLQFNPNVPSLLPVSPNTWQESSQETLQVVHEHYGNRAKQNVNNYQNTAASEKPKLNDIKSFKFKTRYEENDILLELDEGEIDGW